MYHQLLKRTFFLMTLCGSVMLSAGDDAWSKSGSHYSYTRTGKIAPEFLPDGGIKYTFSLGCPEYPFDAGTGSCTPGDLKYSGNATRGPASGVTGTVEYGKDELPTSDTSMSMSGKLIPPEGTEGSQLTWSASATLQSPFWLEASPSDIVKAGTAVTVTAKGDPTESTWTIDSTDWKDHSQSNSEPYKTSSITLNRNMWDKLKWTPNPVPNGYLFPPAGTYTVAATTTEEKNARSADITVTVVDVIFVTPSGDPVTNPSSSNEFVFNNAASGVLTITLAVKVSPAGAIDLVKDNAVFEIDDITGSTKTWHANNPNGKATVSGDQLTATVTFTGLPASNDSFGKKTAKITCSGNGLSFEKTTDYEVFYSATATNHPTCASCAGCPNWFYYYKNASGGGSYKYKSSGRSQSLSAGGDSTVEIADEAYAGDEYITTSIVNGQLVATGWSSTIKYYPVFCGVLAHERQHANQQTNAGPPTDRDSDRLSNTFESNTSQTDPDDAESASGVLGGGWYDREVYAGGPVEQAGIASADKSKDWAYPGSNSQ